jgi:PAT family beta-lactamase induction signal transducer AmpG
MIEGVARLYDVFRSRRMAVLFALGFSSGLPLYLTGQTLQAWFSTAHLDLDSIGALTAVGLAYTFKFAWAPLLDRWRLPWLGRRRGWMAATQLALIAAILALAATDPLEPWAVAAAAIAVAVLSASQDIVLDAYSTDLLAPAERAAGSGVYVMGYRVAMLVSGSFALILADHLPWRAVYSIMAALMSVGVIATLAAEEPAARGTPHTIGQALVVPFTELFGRLGRRGAIAALSFAALYKFGDQFAQALTMAFYQRPDGGFTLTEIGTLQKALGFAGTFVGAALGGALVARYGVWRMLVLFGALQAATNLLYAWLAVAGHDYGVFGTAVLLDQIANAAGTGAFVAYLMSLCSPTVSATQFALLTSLSSVGQRVFGPLASHVQRAVGWSGFFVVTSLLALPGLAMAITMSRSPRRAGSPPETSPSGAA